MTDNKINIIFFHTSPAAIAPLKKYYSRHAPELRVINVLDDGILDFFNTENYQDANNQIITMIGHARLRYDAKAAMITCTAVRRKDLETIQQKLDIPIIKVDVPMAENVLQKHAKIGLVATYRPGGNAAFDLFKETATALNVQPEIHFIMVEGAYESLLNGDKETHDKLLYKAIDTSKNMVDAFVLSQVSMADAEKKAKEITGKPVYSSPTESLTAIKKFLK